MSVKVLPESAVAHRRTAPHSATGRDCSLGLSATQRLQDCSIAKPAFLICTDPQLDLPALLQGYVQRWDIEVNFREEKTLLGVGQAQVRNPHSVEVSAGVAGGLLRHAAAGHDRARSFPNDPLPAAKWAASQTPPRLSTQRAINQLRAEVWGRALGLTNFSDFVACTPPARSPEKFLPHLPSAVLYATN